MNFNHAIVYAPDFDLYLDPTSPLVAFGALPKALYGKPVLNIDEGVVAAIPVLKPEQYILGAHTEFTLGADGIRQVKATFSGSGAGALALRNLAAYLESADQGELAKNRLKAAGLEGTGAYAFANPRTLGEAFAISSTFEITRPVALSGPATVRMAALAAPGGWFSPASFENGRGGPFDCQSLEFRETTSLALPEGVHVYEKPGALSLDKRFRGDTAYGLVEGRIEMTGAVTLDGQIARSESRVRLTFSAAVCPAEFSAEIRDALGKFVEFKNGAIGLTPNPVTQVIEGGSDYALGMKAYEAKNFTYALLKFLLAAGGGNGGACTYLGIMYENGEGVLQDYQQALSWYAKAAALGNAVGQWHLGHLYEAGLGMPQDFKQAFDWYSKAAALGDIYAEDSLADLYEKGQGVAQNYDLARQWYQKAADKNNLRAQANLAHMYQEGKGGLSRDDQQAAQWFRRAADRGYGYAQLQLGVLYAYGRGVPLDRALAIEWFRKAAAQGYDAAQYDLGYAYEKGLGVAQDNQQAIAWYRLAIGKGNADAQARLDAMNGTKGSGFWSGLATLLSSSSR